MSLDAQDWVWTQSKSKGTARLVLLAIADKATGADCSAYAGTTMLVQRSNAARSSVVVAVDNLLASGELAVTAGARGPRGETVYRLPLAVGHRREGGPKSGPVQNPDPSGIRTPRGTESGPPRSENRTPTGPESGPHNQKNAKHQKEHPTPPDDLTTQMLTKWWEQYARTTAQSKTTIRRAIHDALTNGLDANILWQALERLGDLNKPITGGTLTFALSELRRATPSAEVIPLRGQQPDTDLFDRAMNRARTRMQQETS
ncbi:hypothetical protein [Streptomyces sp. NBC_01565]|uniref:hypothetical protein n=1 Tax=Streptomyces sp. NBC_01565 TaxID=2975881 RepID=UPI002258B37E|nr:hypothetical protein [Streptomyces sp. NBC_01565]MCX4540469.1 hypothetical protein [Streptomyces sp. NBC_01565]